jgi:hypothetical protein
MDDPGLGPAGQVGEVGRRLGERFFRFLMPPDLLRELQVQFRHFRRAPVQPGFGGFMRRLKSFLGLAPLADLPLERGIGGGQLGGARHNEQFRNQRP